MHEMGSKAYQPNDNKNIVDAEVMDDLDPSEDPKSDDDCRNRAECDINNDNCWSMANRIHIIGWRPGREDFRWRLKHSDCLQIVYFCN